LPAAGSRRSPTTRADLAEPDDQQRLAAQFVLPPAEIADHAAPMPLRLVVPRLGETPGERQDQRHRMFRDGAVIDPARAGEAYAALRQ
jgi:hypothetical protein